jgi:hypothetical protein
MKHSPFDSSRFWVAVGLLHSENLIALVLLNGGIPLWLTVWCQVIKNGLPSIVATGSLLIAAILLSRTLAAGAWFLMKCMGAGFRKQAFGWGLRCPCFPFMRLSGLLSDYGLGSGAFLSGL